jgi:predicted nucleic acid-binding Zn finger protein
MKMGSFLTKGIQNMKETTLSTLTLEEARMLANIHKRAARLYANGYRVRPTDDENIFEVDSPTGSIYLVNTLLQTCTCPFFVNYEGEYSCKHVLGISSLIRSQYEDRPLTLRENMEVVGELQALVKQRSMIFQCDAKERLAGLLGLRCDTFHSISWWIWDELYKEQERFMEEAKLQFVLYRGHPFPSECPEFGLIEPDQTDFRGFQYVSPWQVATSYRWFLTRLGETPETIFLHIKDMPMERPPEVSMERPEEKIAA